MTEQAKQSGKPLVIIAVVYLTGLLVGGLYVGMVAPVRTVIQADFLIDDAAGIWMINIYTLFYAALIPVIGKLADMHGRKRVFLVCMAMFSLGALLCGLSSWLSSFALLLVGRVVQAIGACGVIPVANAEVAVSFPEEKRGMALGIAAAISGLSNVLGAAAGSLVLDLVGATHWEMLFWCCIPLCLVVICVGMAFLPEHNVKRAGKLDLLGSVLFVLFVLGLLLSLRSVNVFAPASFLTADVLVPLVGALSCLVAFRFVEHRAADPVFHLEYLHSRPIVITMVVSLFVGGVVITMTLVPEFAEYVMGQPAGSGGYYVMAIGVASLFGPPLAGRFIDHFGPKPVMLFGLLVQAAAFAFLALVVAANPSTPALVAGLFLVGLGMGFSMGAPTNYMILENTSVEESTAAVSTIALVRQIGTTLAPAILVGFVANTPGVMGYQQMMLCVVVFCVAASALMLFYRSPRR